MIQLVNLVRSIARKALVAKESREKRILVVCACRYERGSLLKWFRKVRCESHQAQIE